ncbi:serine-rich adhesin for platelets isoform X2 [Scaptodrosophila lebanonensis]|uniref:Serine-rich adhesin for platelets isoform X2 n=1 Tax=Drosophila lebanonensis TaxID=7225 RepID=A0A6J2T5Z0_DROLE|nr:serine-rich adhesin for platelets isoform X2 [Scaptodrosophila lebanonensis]
MAVFLINICKFNGCGITFPSLSDLISHIECTHIDYDPKVVEQKEQAQPACLPLSYVLRFISDDARKEASTFLSNNGGNTTAGNVELKRKLAIKHHSYSMSSSNRSNTPTGSEMDEDEMVVTESEDSNDSWTTEEFSSEFIMRYGSRHSGGGTNGTPGNEKPFACPVPGCKKRYKNVNGIKYHSKNGHKKDGKVRKGYKCHCGKSYKTAQGLKNHALLTHNAQPESVLTTQQVANAAAAAAAAVANGTSPSNGGLTSNANSNVGGIMQRSGSPSQSLGSLSPSSISNMSSSASSCHGGSVVSSLSNNSNVNNNNGGNMLQQLNAGSIVTMTNVSQTSQQQQQQNSSIQLTPQQMQIATTTSTTETSYSCSYTPTTNSNSNSNSSHFNESSSKPSTATTTPIKSTTMRATATATTTAMTANKTTPATTPMQISPTFIEHKYSALAIKEKFFSSLRAPSKSTPVTSSGDVAANVGESGGSAGRNMLGAVAVGQMCALQNEPIHQNLYKKTIN